MNEPSDQTLMLIRVVTDPLKHLFRAWGPRSPDPAPHALSEKWPYIPFDPGQSSFTFIVLACPYYILFQYQKVLVWTLKTTVTVLQPTWCSTGWQGSPHEEDDTAGVHTDMWVGGAWNREDPAHHTSPPPLGQGHCMNSPLSHCWGDTPGLGQYGS